MYRSETKPRKSFFSVINELLPDYTALIRLFIW